MKNIVIMISGRSNNGKGKVADYIMECSNNISTTPV